MAAEVEVKLDKAQVARRISRIFSPDVMRRINQKVGDRVLIRMRDFLDYMARYRHKTANRLGAQPTGYLEMASGRTVLSEVTGESSTITIKNTAGLARAYHPLHIEPKGSKRWLTIPIDPKSYGNSVRDLKARKVRIFRPGKARILAETTDETETYVDREGRKRKRRRIRPLYALVKSVNVPQDRGLMPSDRDLREWAYAALRDRRINDIIETAAALGG